MAPAATLTLTEMRARWDTPGGSRAERAAWTRELAAAILAAPLYSPADASRGRVGEMFIASAGWSQEREAAADATAGAGTPEWRAALGDHEHVTLTSDGRGANRGDWCACNNDDVSASGWIRYEYWTARGCMRHGYVHRKCRRLLQTG